VLKSSTIIVGFIRFFFIATSFIFFVKAVTKRTHTDKKIYQENNDASTAPKKKIMKYLFIFKKNSVFALNVMVKPNTFCYYLPGSFFLNFLAYTVTVCFCFSCFFVVS
jgi:hypothetical protein